MTDLCTTLDTFFFETGSAFDFKFYMGLCIERMDSYWRCEKGLYRKMINFSRRNVSSVEEKITLIKPYSMLGLS